MPLFICDKCGHIENTAYGYFWQPIAHSNPCLCSLCRGGFWHGEFPRRLPLNTDNPDNFLRGKDIAKIKSLRRTAGGRDER